MTLLLRSPGQLRRFPAGQRHPQQLPLSWTTRRNPTCPGRAPSHEHDADSAPTFVRRPAQSSALRHRADSGAGLGAAGELARPLSTRYGVEALALMETKAGSCGLHGAGIVSSVRELIFALDDPSPIASASTWSG